MSSHSSGKPSHLALVKDRRRQRVLTRTVSPDELSSVQAKIAAHVVAVTRSDGVLVGALLGPEPWDVRPMILEKGTISLIRRSDPEITFRPERLSALREIYDRLLDTDHGREAGLSFGENEGQLWIKRRYHQQVFTDLPADADERQNPLEVAKGLIQLIREFHSRGIVHGHISLANLAITARQLSLVDFGFSSLHPAGRNWETTAPEIEKAVMPTKSSDVFGVGLVVRSLLAHQGTNTFDKLIEAMLRSDPILRPTIGAVFNEFSALEGEVKAAPPHRERSTRGKLIAPPPVTKNAPPLGEVEEVEEPPTSPPKTERAPQLNREKAHSHLPVPVAVAIVVATIAFGLFAYRYFTSRPVSSGLPYEAYWTSGQLSLMQRVAEDAVVGGDPEAERVIVEDAIKGTKRSSVSDVILRLVFHPSWRAQLSKRDREAALRIALIGLNLPPTDRRLLDEDNHPALLMAVAGDVAEDKLVKELGVPLTSMAQLPPPFGQAYLELERLGIVDLNHPVARALSHLLAGNPSPRMLSIYFAPVENPSESKNASEVALKNAAATQKKLEILLPFFAEYPNLPGPLYQYLEGANNILAKRIAWINEDPVGVWKDAPKDAILSLAAAVPAKSLSFEQYADSFLFPSATIRRDGVVKLQQMLPRDLTPIMNYLSAPDAPFTREQTVLLMSALRLEGDASYAFVSSWIQTRPDAEAVLGLLVEADSVKGVDALNVEAARYLKDTSWKGTLDLLRRLSRHHDPLARTLAYAHLDPRKPEQAAVLKEAAAAETKVNLRAQVLERLAVAGQ